MFVRTPAFHTGKLEYPPVSRTVYHTETDCSLARAIEPADRVDGTGGLPHCQECEAVEQARFPGRAERVGARDL